MSFELLAVPHAHARLDKPEGTLGGSVPLRVAQACVPLLEGNALGHHIVMRDRIVLHSRVGQNGVARSDTSERIDRAMRAAVPMLVARGYLHRGGAWHKRLEKRWWWTERGVLRIWTGLLVRPHAGTWLRVSGLGNHAPRTAHVRPVHIGSSGYVPLVVDFDALDHGARLEGDIASVFPVLADVTVTLSDLDHERGMLEAHARFYDAKYFSTKKGQTTRKYRRTIAKKDEAPAPGGAEVRVAHFAGPRPEVIRVDRVLDTGSLTPQPASHGEHLDIVRFGNAVPFSAHFDGHSLDVTPDKRALTRGARTVEEAIAQAGGEDFAEAHRGALLYLTKYFTPHPHGEAHFFVKPWAFTATPPGWSTIIDGMRGPGWEVMRGVVWTDRFHATPAVFDVTPMRRIRVAESTPLMEAIAVPRALLEEEPEIVEEDFS